MNRLVLAAAVLGFAGVALGAFGAHALDAQLTEESRGWWDTATLYVLPHAAAALAAGLSGRGGRGGRTALGGWLFVIGTVIFAGSLYAMSLGAPRWFGAITPIGGLSLLAGWLALAASAIKKV
jgi:uncharacterized membrane protein YgdD (TMEM256/DUF423 family)